VFAKRVAFGVKTKQEIVSPAATQVAVRRIAQHLPNPRKHGRIGKGRGRIGIKLEKRAAGERLIGRELRLKILR
jgi:hypothetical protein